MGRQRHEVNGDPELRRSLALAAQFTLIAENAAATALDSAEPAP